MTDTESQDARLGALLERYQDMRALDPAADVGRLRAEAGDLFPELEELAACLDSFDGEGPSPAASSPAQGPAGRSRLKPWVLGAGGMLAILGILGAALGWYAAPPSPAVLTVITHPKAEVEIDGRPQGEGPLPPGSYLVTAKARGFEPAETRIELTGHPTTIEIDLEPSEPMDLDALIRLARSHGIDEGNARIILPRPIGLPSPSDEAERLEVRHPEAIERELERFPESLRSRPGIRLIGARQLCRAGLFAEAYAVAHPLAVAHPEIAATWECCAWALWGLDLVETDLYREVLARLASALASK